jgi:hypothetical protein
MYQQAQSLTQSSSPPTRYKPLFSLMQIVIGVSLVIASSYGFTLLQHMAATIPALMGTALIFFGAKTLLVGFTGSLFRNQRQQTGRMHG